MRLIASAAAYSLIGGIAAAADMPPPRFTPIVPPVVAEVANWTGFYIGANAGGGFATADNDFSVAGGATFASIDLPMKGGLGGGQLGYNWQSGAMVYGVEADFQGTSLQGSIRTPCVPPFCGAPLSASYTEKLPWFGTVRGRIGYAQSGWLLYATGGYAYGRVETNATATAGPVTAALSTAETRSGWTIGGGAELMFAPRWTFKVEYLFVDLGSTANSFPFTGLPTLNTSTHVTVNAARAGVNYRF